MLAEIVLFEHISLLVSLPYEEYEEEAFQRKDLCECSGQGQAAWRKKECKPSVSPSAKKKNEIVKGIDKQLGIKAEENVENYTYTIGGLLQCDQVSTMTAEHLYEDPEYLE